MEELIMQTSRLLYQNQIEEGNKLVNETINRLIVYLNGQPANKVARINQILINGLNAMEAGDAVLLADILRFDLLPEL